MSAAWTRTLALPPARLVTSTVHEVPAQLVRAGDQVFPSSQDSCTVGLTTGLVVTPLGIVNATVKVNLPAGALLVEDSGIR